jgi:hypothetical protein
MEKLLEDCLSQEINYYKRKGLIFVCQRGEFHRYVDDLFNLLKNIGFYSTFQEVNENKIYEDLRIRLKEQLPVSVEIITDGELEGKLLTPIIEISSGLSKSIKTSFQQANTLQGLIENYLKHISPSLLPDVIRNRISANLMIAITNADNCELNGLRSVIKEIFNSRTNAGQKAGIILVSFLNPNIENPIISPSNLEEPSSWYMFNPSGEIKQHSQIIWNNLENSGRALFENSNVLRNILVQSQGSEGMLRQTWSEIWTKLREENRDRINENDLN